IWRIYSMTKPIIGVALMTLYEQGHFQLADPVARWIPEWRDLKVKERQPDGSVALVRPRRPMSVRDTLMHMTGLGWGTDHLPPMKKFLEAVTALRGGPEGTLATMIATLATKPLEFHPGEHWPYGVSTDVVGHLIEQMSGQPLDVYLRDHVFGPLQMRHTGF